MQVVRRRAYAALSYWLGLPGLPTFPSDVPLLPLAAPMALSPAAARAPAMFNNKAASFVAAGPALPAFGKLERTGAMEALQVHRYKFGRPAELRRHPGSGTADQAMMKFDGCRGQQLLLQWVLEALGSREMQAAWVQLARLSLFHLAGRDRG